METLALILTHWKELATAAGVLALFAIAWDINHTYDVVREQKQEIADLRQEVDNAKHAVQLQADINKALGRIDARTYTNISTILHKPVGRVLISSGM